MEEKVKRKNRTYTGKFKQKVIEDMHNNQFGYRETGRKYDIDGNTIRAWERIYIEEGVEQLYIERRGKNAKGKGRPMKLGKKIEEDIIAEVQRLRMENEYLKKLNALVCEREKSQKETKL